MHVQCLDAYWHLNIIVTIYCDIMVCTCEYISDVNILLKVIKSEGMVMLIECLNINHGNILG